MKSSAQQALIGAVRGFAQRHLSPRAVSSLEPGSSLEPRRKPLESGSPLEHRRKAVCVALSGGADSLALTAAAVRAGLAVTALVVDHGLQEGSAAVAAAAAECARGLGARAQVLTVEVDGPGGLEAAARAARYAALDSARDGRPVLLGHTLDDQAETVLLGLGRGSGARSLAGMAAWSDPWGRPLLGIRRAQTHRACADWGLSVWDDPHNSDPRFTRVRLRHEVLPLLDDVLGGGVPEALGRTADQLRADAEALESFAAELLARARTAGGISVRELAGAPTAVRTRALRSWLTESGAVEPSARLVAQIDALVSDWRGQGPVAIGGDDAARLVVTRRAAMLTVRRDPR
ncbi:tRNA lysidine(34) synthetase TilS [Gordonia iterans]|uniref:tRNA lysidine(34) synthetase TilS n=1 Tax=Gordonia iterans TaxID=1004901 RepID=UPI001F3FCD16|nr:tRNA lysidine(34) synthetase TilS [Gordonia iterans]